MNSSYDEFNSCPPSEYNARQLREDNKLSLDGGFNKTVGYSNSVASSKTAKVKNDSLQQSVLRRMLSSFVVVCATAAVVQTSIEIPVFNEIFHPDSVVETVIDVPEVVSPSTEDDGGGISVPSITVDVKIDLSHPIDKYIRTPISPAATFTSYNCFLVCLVDESGVEFPPPIIGHKGYLDNIMFTINKTTPPQKYTLMIYCNADDVEQFGSAHSRVYDELTYYHIYTHPTTIYV